MSKESSAMPPSLCSGWGDGPWVCAYKDCPVPENTVKNNESRVRTSDGRFWHLRCHDTFLSPPSKSKGLEVKSTWGRKRRRKRKK